jgi:hypothetical protein
MIHFARKSEFWIKASWAIRSELRDPPLLTEGLIFLNNLFSLNNIGSQ